MKIPDSRTLPLAAALVALTMAPAASAATPVYREIKDWVVACDNTARCEAIGMQEGYPAAHPAAGGRCGSFGRT